MKYLAHSFWIFSSVTMYGVGIGCGWGYASARYTMHRSNSVWISTPDTLGGALENSLTYPMPPAPSPPPPQEGSHAAACDAYGWFVKVLHHMQAKTGLAYLPSTEPGACSCKKGVDDAEVEVECHSFPYKVDMTSSGIPALNSNCVNTSWTLTENGVASNSCPKIKPHTLNISDIRNINMSDVRDPHFASYLPAAAEYTPLWEASTMECKYLPQNSCTIKTRFPHITGENVWPNFRINIDYIEAMVKVPPVIQYLYESNNRIILYVKDRNVGSVCMGSGSTPVKVHIVDDCVLQCTSNVNTCGFAQYDASTSTCTLYPHVSTCTLASTIPAAPNTFTFWNPLPSIGLTDSGDLNVGAGLPTSCTGAAQSLLTAKDCWKACPLASCETAVINTYTNPGQCVTYNCQPGTDASTGVAIYNRPNHPPPPPPPPPPMFTMCPSNTSRYGAYVLTVHITTCCNDKSHSSPCIEKVFTPPAGYRVCNNNDRWGVIVSTEVRNKDCCDFHYKNLPACLPWPTTDPPQRHHD